MERQDLKIFNCGKHVSMLDIRGTLLFYDIFHMLVFYYLFVQNASHYFYHKIELTIFNIPFKVFWRK